MDLSKEELDLLHAYAKSETAGRRWGFYVAVLLPVVLFTVYGTIREDYIALLVAVIGLLGYVLWHISSEARYAVLVQSIAAKVLAARSSEEVG